MSKRYSVKPLAAWLSETAWAEGRPTCEVFETPQAPIDTGLVSTSGLPILRMPKPRSIGFKSRRETER